MLAAGCGCFVGAVVAPAGGGADVVVVVLADDDDRVGAVVVADVVGAEGLLPGVVLAPNGHAVAALRAAQRGRSAVSCVRASSRRARRTRPCGRRRSSSSELTVTVNSLLWRSTGRSVTAVVSVTVRVGAMKSSAVTSSWLLGLPARSSTAPPNMETSGVASGARPRPTAGRCAPAGGRPSHSSRRCPAGTPRRQVSLLHLPSCGAGLDDARPPRRPRRGTCPRRCS